LTLYSKNIEYQLRREKMRNKKLFPAIAAIVAAILISGCLSSAPEDPEKAGWDMAKRSFTVKAFESYLVAYPSGANAEKANAYIADLKKADEQSPRMVEGTVENVNRELNEVTIRTAMDEKEVIRFNDDTAISSSAENKKTIGGMGVGDKLQTNYVNLPGGYLLAKSTKVMIGYTIAHCSCGAGCDCPLSKGCRTITYK
jgi:hypothetical protein